MGRDLELAARLRHLGVPVIEVAGWQTRGSETFDPRGSVNHHTAGPSSGTVPSLAVVVEGRSDLEGPLCNVLQSREPDGRDVAYVVAAGRANHAGSGGWRDLEGNSSVWGLEIEHDGVSPLPMGRQETAARIHAAMLGGMLYPDAEMVCQHREWAPERKIDAAQGVDANGFRAMVARALWPPDDPGDDPMARYPIDLPCPAALAQPDPLGRMPFWRLTGPDGGIQAWNGAPFLGSVPEHDDRSDCVGLLERQDRFGYVVTTSEGDTADSTSPTFAFPV